MSAFDKYLQSVQRIQPKSGYDWTVYNESNHLNMLGIWTKAAKTIVPEWKDHYPKVTEQLIYYLLRSDKFFGNLNKGILLEGPTGTGKTKALRILSLVMGHVQKYRFKIYSGIEMERAYRQGGFESDLEAMMFGFDDIGEEHDKVKVYGSDINVGIEVLTVRYNQQERTGALTFGTTNLDDDMFLEKYGKRIASRKKELFNVIYMNGEDLRK